MATKPKSYEEAYNELKSLSEKLESDEVGIDQLAEAVERARVLVKYCQEKLRSTEKLLSKGNDD